ncbi:hypothetical protein IMZ48_34590 [Candidatus Bathyarchaeota archaeon]|nr:hypothetical protein [Candidatus Bathyarchaeota archaeon]
MEEGDAKDGDHGAGVDNLEGVDGVPDRLLGAGELLINGEDGGLDEAEDLVIQGDDQPFVELAVGLLVVGAFQRVLVVDVDVVRLGVYSDGVRKRVK